MCALDFRPYTVQQLKPWQHEPGSKPKVHSQQKVKENLKTNDNNILYIFIKQLKLNMTWRGNTQASVTVTQKLSFCSALTTITINTSYVPSPFKFIQSKLYFSIHQSCIVVQLTMFTPVCGFSIEPDSCKPLCPFPNASASSVAWQTSPSRTLHKDRSHTLYDFSQEQSKKQRGLYPIQ